MLLRIHDFLLWIVAEKKVAWILFFVKSEIFYGISVLKVSKIYENWKVKRTIREIRFGNCAFSITGDFLSSFQRLNCTFSSAICAFTITKCAFCVTNPGKRNELTPGMNISENSFVTFNAAFLFIIFNAPKTFLPVHLTFQLSQWGFAGNFSERCLIFFWQNAIVTESVPSCEFHRYVFKSKRYVYEKQ